MNGGIGYGLGPGLGRVSRLGSAYAVVGRALTCYLVVLEVAAQNTANTGDVSAPLNSVVGHPLRHVKLPMLETKCTTLRSFTRFGRRPTLRRVPLGRD